jgi:hypothetical protein
MVSILTPLKQTDMLEEHVDSIFRAEKYAMTSRTLHVIFQKTEPFITFPVRTSEPTVKSQIPRGYDDRETEMLFSYVLYVCQPLWSSGQSSWLQIQRPRVRFPALPDLLRNSGSGTGPLSLVSITEELFEWKSSGSGV